MLHKIREWDVSPAHLEASPRRGRDSNKNISSFGKHKDTLIRCDATNMGYGDVYINGVMPTQKISSKKNPKRKHEENHIWIFVCFHFGGWLSMGAGGGGLKMKYYHKKCGSISVENTVRNIVWSKVATNPTMATKLLRLHYHDWFVRTTLEAECAGIVSCADIVALAARDAVSFQGSRTCFAMLV
ncbi:hypothetical protein OSB04_010533 [Centaurea solstitialis]|uniref:peroxidase n=1 Tax=Centaurea solstitialis TaxID=347529 RepID=A0AA38WN92_9ASTR|nr:hypothetical protein OSB04_010533 [Centaurea solstitialis]